jgi:hypothetical protein
MASYTPYRPNITDDEWYNFICGFIAGLKLRNKDNGFHETNQIVEDVPIGEEPSDMGIRILPNKYVSLSETSSVLRIPVYSHDVKTSYGAFDVSISAEPLGNTGAYIERIEASTSYTGSLTSRYNAELNTWYIEGRSLTNSNDYNKAIVLFYIVCSLNLYGEYHEGDTLGKIQGLPTYKLNTEPVTYRYISELYKYDNESLNIISPSSQINTGFIVLKELTKDGEIVYNNSSSLGDKINLKTMGLGSKAHTPDEYDVYIDTGRSYFELPVKILLGERDRAEAVRINHIIIEMTFYKEAYGYERGMFCSSEYLSLSLLINKNGWTWTSADSYESNGMWHLRLEGNSSSSSYDVYEDTDVLGLGLRGLACPYS